MAIWDELTTRYEIAGAVGSVLGWLVAPGGTLKQQAFSLLAGLACALWVAPFLIDANQVTSQNGKFFVVFLTGSLGANLLAKTIAATEGLKAADVGEYLLSLLPGRRGPK